MAPLDKPQDISERAGPKCDVCGYKPKSPSAHAVKIHKDAVHAGLKYTCPQCDLEFSIKSNLYKHISQDHKAGNYPCIHCDQEFIYKCDLKLHKRREHPKVAKEGKVKTEPKKQIVECDLCGYRPSYPSMAAVKIHKDSVHFGIKHGCPKCGKQCTTKANLSKHFAEVHEGRRIKCDQCHFTVKGNNQLKIHIETKHLGLRYYCTEQDCNNSFQSSPGLRNHTFEKHTEKTIPCLVCTDKFASTQSFKRHIRIQHNGHFCEICCYQLLNEEMLLLHNTELHNGVKNTCDQCGRDEPSQMRLKMHQWDEHRVKNKWKSCAEVYMTNCQFSTLKEQRLHEHYRVKHEGLTYDCPQCQLGFTSKKRLQCHVRVKHEGMSYNCSQCQVDFTSNSALKTHIDYTHKGIAYDCSLCDHIAESKLKLSSHVKRIHNAPVLDCGECNVKSVDAEYMKIHKRGHDEYEKWAVANGIET
jgi:hypothetical protein